MALGPELITGGDMSNPASWTTAGGIVIANDIGTYDGVASNQNMYQSLSLTDGTSYRVSIEILSITDSPPDKAAIWFYGASQLFDGVLNSKQALDIGVHTWDVNCILTSAIFQMYFYNDYQQNAFTFDNVSLKEILPDTTTTVEIEWIDSISAASTGNKIYRDDVEIADVANGIQIYQDATAETGTEYKYEVQAYSATDETTQEVLGVNVQYITTA